MSPSVIRLFPFLSWIREASPSSIRADCIAGLTVALVLIPQSMAYAQLAGLPVHYGLYASLLPAIVGALFGSSRQLSTGPVALVSLLTAAALEPLAVAGSEAYIAYAALLALMAGIVQLSLGILRLGFVVNFISHPVLLAYINAAAFIIACSQIPALLGVSVPRADHFLTFIARVLREAAADFHGPTFAMGAFALALMAGLRRWRPRLPHILITVVLATLLSWLVSFEKTATIPLSRIADEESRAAVEAFNAALAGPASAHEARHALRSLRFALEEEEGGIVARRVGHAPIRGEARLWRIQAGASALDPGQLRLLSGGATVGEIPQRFPALKAPTFDLDMAGRLFSMALVIALLGFLEAISIAKAMASRTGQRLDPNQELIGQGLAQVSSAFSQGYPTSGSFSRSTVNLAAGARSGLSSVVAGGMVGLTLLFFTPLLHHLPKSVLAAIIMMSVFSLLNVRGMLHVWRMGQGHGVIAAMTLIATLAFAPHLEIGLLVGVVLSLSVFLYRRMRPEVALLSKHSDGTYRDASRFGFRLCRHIAVIRFDGSLFFANAAYLEDKILDRIAAMPDLRLIIIAGEAINDLDATGEEMLSRQIALLRQSGRDIAFAGLHSHINDVMKRVGLEKKIGEDRLFRTIAAALDALHEKTHEGTIEEDCPLLKVCPIHSNDTPDTSTDPSGASQDN